MIFIDAGPFLARDLASDQHHEEAVAGWRLLADSREPCCTSNFVLNEAWTLLGRRGGHALAAGRAREALDSKVLRILRPDAAQEREAVDWFAKYADQAVSFTDCVSFVLMREAKVARAFAFDRHFARAGFQLWPG